MNLNKVFLIGNLTHDPDVRTTPGGQSVATLRMATNRIWNDAQTGQKQQKTEYHTVILWRRLAEIAGQYLAKGSLVFIEGRIETRSWQDKTSGDKRYRTEIIAEGIQLGPRRYGAPTGSDESADAVKPAGANPDKVEQKPAEEDLPVIQEEEPEIAVKDIPF